MTRNQIYLALLLNIIGGLIVLLVFQPALNWARNAALSVLSAGSQHIKDGYYQRVATGFHSSTRQTVAVFGAILCIGLYLSPESHGDILLRVLIVLNLLAMIAILMQETSTHEAILHFRQVMSIVTPFLSHDKLVTYESRFAQMTTRIHYVSLLSELKATARAHHCRVPAFTPW
jgi:hypothetical protein